MPRSPEIRQLLDGLEEAFQRRSWHGTNLLGSIRGLDPKSALWRPVRRRHNIWEVVVHAAYWKYAVARRLTGARRGSFPLSGSNWFLRAGGTRADWRRDITLLKEAHAGLVQAVERLPGTMLARRPPGGGKWTAEQMIRGVAVHDLYHAGQIQLLKRLQA